MKHPTEARFNLSKSGITNTRESAHDESRRLIESSDLIETCVVLRDTVTNVTAVVSNLSGEVRNPRDKIALLELRHSVYDGLNRKPYICLQPKLNVANQKSISYATVVYWISCLTIKTH